LEPEQFRAFLADIHQHYDYVLMEAAALNQYSDAQELVPFADKVLAVFNANSVLKTADNDALEFLRALDGKFAGAVLTEVDARNVA